MNLVQVGGCSWLLPLFGVAETDEFWNGVRNATGGGRGAGGARPAPRTARPTGCEAPRTPMRPACRAVGGFDGPAASCGGAVPQDDRIARPEGLGHHPRDRGHGVGTVVDLLGRRYIFRGGGAPAHRHGHHGRGGGRELPDRSAPLHPDGGTGPRRRSSLRTRPLAPPPIPSAALAGREGRPRCRGPWRIRRPPSDKKNAHVRSVTERTLRTR